MTAPRESGYRFLEGHEILIEGDEYFHQLLRTWNKTGQFGQTVFADNVFIFTYRRKIETDNGRPANTNERSSDVVPEAGAVSDSAGIGKIPGD